MPLSPREMSCVGAFPARVTWMWERWRAIAMPRIICGRTPGVHPGQPRQAERAGSDASAEDIADLAINFGAVAAGLIDQLRPFFRSIIQLGLGQQVRGLHNGFHRVAEIMRQGP